MNNQNTSDSTGTLSMFSGAIDYPLTNDYMFRSVMQSSDNVLKGLLSSLLHLNKEDISSVEILNPIELGKAIADKDFFLDIKILMNDNTVINLEMQMYNEYNWPERSLIYLCRLFDNLNSGENYSQVRPAFQIGILNFAPFPKHPEFYSTYKLMNLKNHQVYSDKFTLHVLNLTQIHKATEEDKNYDLDNWARLFKAVTWEDFKMISANNENMQEAGKTLYSLSRDEQIRYQCEAREDYKRTWNTVKLRFEEYRNEIAGLKSAIEELESVVNKKDSDIAQNEITIAGLKAQIAKLQIQLQNTSRRV